MRRAEKNADIRVGICDNDPVTTAYFFVYGGQSDTKRNEVQLRSARMQRYLIDSRGIEPERVKIIAAGFRERFTVGVRLISTGEDIPKPTPSISREKIRFKTGEMPNWEEPGCYAKSEMAQENGDNCENVSARLDGIRNDFVSKIPTQVIILVARVGTKERTGSLNQRRLYTIKRYLTAVGVQKDQIISATGDIIGGNGVVEIYYEGQLMDSIVAGKNADIPVGSCENDVEDYKKYQLPKVPSESRKR